MKYKEFIKVYKDVFKEIYFENFRNTLSNSIFTPDGLFTIGVCKYVNKKYKFNLSDNILSVSRCSGLRYRDYVERHILMLRFDDSYFKLINGDSSICIDIADMDTIYSIVKRDSSDIISCDIFDFKKVFKRVVGYNFDRYIEKTLYLFYNILFSIEDMTVGEIYELYKEYMFIIYGNDFWNVHRLYEKRYTKLVGDYLINVTKRKVIEYSINNGIKYDGINDGINYGIDYNVGESL